MYKSIYIVETVGQVKYILDNHKKLSNENYYISITPIVHAKLSVNNYNVISYTDILSNNFSVALSQDRYKLLQDIYAEFNKSKKFKTNSAAHTFEYYFNYILNYIVLLIMIINRVKLKFAGAVIKSVPDAIKNDNGSKLSFSNIRINPFIMNNEVFSSYLLNNQDKVVRRREEVVFERRLYSWVISFINRTSLILFRFKKTALILTGDRNIPSYLNESKKKNNTYLYLRMSDKKPYSEMLYSIWNLYKHITKRKFDINGFKYDGIISLTGFFDRDEINRINGEIENISEVFQYDGVSFYNVISHKLIDIVIYCNYLDCIYDNAKNFLRTIKNYSVLSHVSNGFQELVAEACNQNGSSFLIPHASVISSEDKILNRELMEFDANRLLKDTPYKNLIIQSPFSMRVVEKYNIDGVIYKSRPVVWGASCEDFNRVDKSVKTILHVDTASGRSSIRPIHFIDIFKYIETIVDLAKCVQDMNDVDLIIRIREDECLDAETLNYYLDSYNNVRVVSDKTFTYYLQYADVVVSRSSTAIEEALLQDIPVLLYDITNQNKILDIAQDISLGDFSIENYVLYLTRKDLLSCTINSMLDFDYNAITNDYTYRNEDLFMIPDS